MLAMAGAPCSRARPSSFVRRTARTHEGDRRSARSLTSFARLLPRLASQPVGTRGSPPLPPAADRRPHAVFPGPSLSVDGVPAAAGRKVKHADVTAGQDLKRLVDLVALIELCASGRPKRLKPRREDEIGYQGLADRVSELVVLARIADLVSIKPSRISGVRVGLDRRQIDVRIGEHLQQLVAGGYRPLKLQLQVSPRENLPFRQAFGSEVVITEGVRLVRIIEHGQPPRAAGGARALGYKSQVRVNPPSRGQIRAYLGLKVRDRRAHLRVV